MYEQAASKIYLERIKKKKNVEGNRRDKYIFTDSEWAGRLFQEGYK